MAIDLKEILRKFDLDSAITPYGNGHINDTYSVEIPRYLLQRINTNIFTNPEELMENIENVTAFVRKKIVEEGGNPDRETLTVVKTLDGKNFFRYDDSNSFRVYKFITNTKSIETDKTNEDLFRAGKAFGRFAKMLSEYPADTLHETIKDFHNTPKRVEALKKAIDENIAGRADSVKEEIDFALKYAVMADTVTSGIKDGRIPLRVTHNDTKINNVLFDMDSNEAICVIDLDTIMPGSMLYDFGDALRMGASTALEDETDLDKVHFDCEAFMCFANGYLGEMGNDLTEYEFELLPFSAKLMTYECGIRFLTDYLNGDTYFKIHREHHNLDRARNQFKLVAEIDEKEAELKELLKNR